MSYYYISIFDFASNPIFMCKEPKFIANSRNDCNVIYKWNKIKHETNKSIKSLLFCYRRSRSISFDATQRETPFSNVIGYFITSELSTEQFNTIFLTVNYLHSRDYFVPTLNDLMKTLYTILHNGTRWYLGVAV